VPAEVPLVSRYDASADLVDEFGWFGPLSLRSGLPVRGCQKCCERDDLRVAGSEDGGVGLAHSPARSVEDQHESLEVVVVDALMVPAAADVSGVLVGGRGVLSTVAANESAVAAVCLQDVGLLGQVGLSTRVVIVAVADPAAVAVADDVVLVVPAPGWARLVPSDESAIRAGRPSTSAR